jgi:ABC-type transport system substrate-binding protein
MTRRAKPAAAPRLDRRRATQRIAAAALAGSLPALGRGQATLATPSAPPKVLRYAFLVAETGMDPVRLSDGYSRTLTPHIFEALYQYDHLARPIKVKPLTADGEPTSSPDFRVWTVRLQRGIYFADDPAFQGKARELVAADYVYAYKRFADPVYASPGWGSFENINFVGLNALHKAALDGKKRFDYDREIEGIKALDRYTLQFKLEGPRPRFAETMAGSDLYGAVAREVVEFYGDQIDAHPVGTGPFRLVEWRRSSRIVFERNPSYRERLYDAEPAADDAEGQALAARFKGRRLPMIDRVEVAVIEEQQPRWLSFVNGEADYVERVSADFITTAMPKGKVAPNLAKRGIRGYQQIEPGATFLLFNMDDAVFGGYTPERVALRRAIALSLDTGREISLLRRDQAVYAQTLYLPYTKAYDAKFRSEFSEFDPARAKALLDLYGYHDRDGDGWRERPDGTPMTLHVSSQPDLNSRQLNELLQKNVQAVGVRVAFDVAKWPENLKAARAGKLVSWGLASGADGCDSVSSLARYDSRQIGGQNLARVRLPELDVIYDKLQVLPDGAERQALFDEAARLSIAYMPYKYRVSRIVTDMTYPWLIGYRRPIFWQEWWHYVDIDTGVQNHKLG